MQRIILVTYKLVPIRADKFTIKSNLEERNIAKRDFVGLDCNAWVYDLFRPNEPYELRGIHPIGNWIGSLYKI